VPFEKKKQNTKCQKQFAIISDNSLEKLRLQIAREVEKILQLMQRRLHILLKATEFLRLMVMGS